jgi:DNA-binding beta-propeller fold protein YncE
MLKFTMSTLAVAFGVVLAGAVQADAQGYPNPFRPNYSWGQLPEGRTWGSTSAVYPTPDGMGIWVAERCGRSPEAPYRALNSCGSRPDLDPIMLFDLDGKLIRSFGAGKVSWPHGIHVDSEGNVWVTDAFRPNQGGLGHTVLKFSPTGELLLTIGTPGQAGDPPLLDQPNDVAVAPNGDVFIVQSHGAGTARHAVLKFSRDGTFIKKIGEPGFGPLQWREPHAIAIDAQGRLFIGDRYNNRIQIIDQEGTFIASWTQFGRPSGIYIKGDVIAVADSESAPDGNNPYTGQRNAGWAKGIRIGSVSSGWVHYFIPDDNPNPGGFSGAEGVAIDAQGNVYGAEVSQARVTKHTRLIPVGP